MDVGPSVCERPLAVCSTTGVSASQCSAFFPSTTRMRSKATSGLGPKPV